MTRNSTRATHLVRLPLALFAIMALAQRVGAEAAVFIILLLAFFPLSIAR